MFWIFCAIVVDQQIDRDILTELQDSDKALQAPDSVFMTDTVFVYGNREKVPQTLSDSVKWYLNEVGMAHPEIVFKQCLLESGWFTSPIWRENHNCIGMKYAKQRPTLAIGENRKHAVFKSWKDCLLDLRIWQIKYYRDTTENYYNFLERKGYAESAVYKQKLENFK